MNMPFKGVTTTYIYNNIILLFSKVLTKCNGVEIKYHFYLTKRKYKILIHVIKLILNQRKIKKELAHWHTPRQELYYLKKTKTLRLRAFFLF